MSFFHILMIVLFFFSGNKNLKGWHWFADSVHVCRRWVGTIGLYDESNLMLMPCWWDKVICGWNMRNTTKLRHHHEILCANMSFLLLFLFLVLRVLTNMCWVLSSWSLVMICERYFVFGVIMEMTWDRN